MKVTILPKLIPVIVVPRIKLKIVPVARLEITLRSLVEGVVDIMCIDGAVIHTPPIGLAGDLGR